ncbi:MAG TPA: hypothetical protein VNA57_07525 [Acidimicrobiales bacterium]|nr:hypothetical protein [Acidimicrobiales bacterium]
MTRGKSRKGIVFTTVAGAAVLALSSAAVACISYEGKMTVQTGSTSSTVIGDPPYDHKHCSIAGGAATDSTDSTTGTVTVTVEAYTNQGASDLCPSSKLYKSNGSEELTHYAPNPDDCQGQPDPLSFLPGESDITSGNLAAVTQTEGWTCQFGYDRQDDIGIGAYEVRFMNGNGFTRTTGANPTYTHVQSNPNLTCAGPPENPPTNYILLGHMDVDDAGYGTWTGSLPTDAELIPNGPTDAAGICVRAHRDSTYYHGEMRAGNQAPIVVM